MEERPKLKLITTQDGSHSLMREDLNETYHSFHGAMGESQYVFIEQGLDWRAQQGNAQSLKVFEVGFGTGLNAYLVAEWAVKNEVEIEFHSVEPFPVPRELYEQFNYAKSEAGNQLLQQLHNVPWDSLQNIHDHFSLVKYTSTLEEFRSSLKFDLIFFDAFAPSKQAEVWSLENLQKCFEMTNAGGYLTTYCAQGQFKRNLAEAGYEVETLKGAMGKKEMVRGLKF